MIKPATFNGREVTFISMGEGDVGIRAAATEDRKTALVSLENQPAEPVGTTSKQQVDFTELEPEVIIEFTDPRSIVALVSALNYAKRKMIPRYIVRLTEHTFLKEPPEDSIYKLETTQYPEMAYTYNVNDARLMMAKLRKRFPEICVERL